MFDWLRDKAGDAWNSVTGFIGRRTDEALEHVTGAVERRVDSTIGQVTENLDENTGGWFSRLFGNARLSNAGGGEDGFFNWKSGIGGAIGGILGFMMSGLVGLIVTPLKWLSHLLPGAIGMPIRGALSMFSNKLSTAAGGAALGMALTNIFTATNAPAAETAPDAQTAPSAMQRQMTADGIRNGISGIFADAQISAEEMPRLRSLLEEHRAADPRGYATLIGQLRTENPTLFAQLEL